jgi:hypothetical protein
MPPAKSLNRSLHAAKATKQDEFYTQLPDIEKELKHYTQHFAGKTVLCNCDDPTVSNFFRYFSRKFDDLKLKRVITTSYRNANPDLFSQNQSGRSVKLIYEGERTPGAACRPRPVSASTRWSVMATSAVPSASRF